MSESSPEPAPTLTVDCWRVNVSGLSAAQTAAWDSADVDQRHRAAQLACSALRRLSGGVIEPCLYVVRPCSTPPADKTYRVFPVAGAGFNGFAPALDSGTWINVRCGSCGGGSGCGHRLSSIRLPGARAVVQVTIDGLALDSSAWRLDGDRLLRLDGGVWPAQQNLAASLDGVNTFGVSFYKDRPGVAGELAAGSLASEFLSFILTGKCQLPSSVTSVIRNGVSITKSPGVFPGGLTGLRDVDAWLTAVNPTGQREVSEVLSPDLPILHGAGGGNISWTPPAGGFDGGGP